MTQFFQTFTCGYSNQSGRSAGLTPWAVAAWNTTLLGSTNAVPGGITGSWTLQGIPGMEIVRVQLMSLSETTWLQSTGDLRTPQIGLGNFFWLGPASVTPVVDNGGSVGWTAYDSPLASAPTVRFPTILLDGTAFADIADDDPNTSLQCNVLYRESQMGLRFNTQTSGTPENTRYSYAFGDFLDTADGDNASLTTNFVDTAAIDRLRGIFRSANTTTSVTVLGGGSLTIQHCGASFNDPFRFVWIEAGDVGGAAGQIPLAQDNPTAAQIRNHPSVFFRQTNRMRAIRASVYEVEAQNTTGNVGGTNSGITSRFAIGLLEVFERPTHSRWTFSVDGEEFQAVIVHPEGSDLKRPREIWNTVIVPAIRASNTLSGVGLQVFEDVNSGGPRIFRPVGLLQRLDYLDYARFLEPLNANPGRITTLVSQNIP